MNTYNEEGRETETIRNSDEVRDCCFAEITANAKKEALDAYCDSMKLFMEIVDDEIKFEQRKQEFNELKKQAKIENIKFMKRLSKADCIEEFIADAPFFREFRMDLTKRKREINSFRLLLRCMRDSIDQKKEELKEIESRLQGFVEDMPDEEEVCLPKGSCGMNLIM